MGTLKTLDSTPSPLPTERHAHKHTHIHTQTQTKARLPLLKVSYENSASESRTVLLMHPVLATL